MKYYFTHGLEIAKDFELPQQYALNARMRYLTKMISDLSKARAKDLAYRGNEVTMAFTKLSAQETQDKIDHLKKELDAIKRCGQTQSSITDDMIERARQYPIDKLIDFTRGKAIAFCHEDRHPSMFHGTKFNIAVCPVCDKKFNPIDVLVKRDGMSFTNAVKQLS